MSFIPKINLGILDQRETHNLSQDTTTSCNIGFVQPVFAREMIPNATFSLNGVRQVTRLASLNVPSMLRLQQRLYHVFVPFNSLYFPFDSLLSGQVYTNSSGNTFNVTSLHWLTYKELFNCLFQDGSRTGASLNRWFYASIYDSPNDDPDDAWSMDANKFNILTSTAFGVNIGDFYNLPCVYLDDSTPKYIVRRSSTDVSVSYPCNGKFDVVTFDNADYILSSNVANKPIICLRLTPEGKRLRQIFLGLGYQFSPFSETKFNLLKLLAYYKAYFQLFCVQRSINFYMTNCYKIISAISNNNGNSLQSSFYNVDSFYMGFLYDLAMCYYQMPADYFSMSTTTPTPGSSSIAISSAQSSGSPTGAISNSQTGAYTSLNGSAGSTASILATNMAQRLFRFVNKNTVIGKNIRDYLRSTYGVVDDHDLIHEEVVKLGASSIDVGINDVVSTADTVESGGSSLGSYSGIGIGRGGSQALRYTSKEFGVWITMCAIIPQNGYVQGTLRENCELERFDFFTPDFDALGYQTLNNYELRDDFAVNGGVISNPLSTFGFVPRYSHLKVGRNILNGDISLRSTRSQLGCYTLDRWFGGDGITHSSSSGIWDVDNKILMPISNVQNTDTFRTIGRYESMGNYNRIFQYVDDNYDHYIQHFVFDVVAKLPAKSLSNSYDTMEEAEHTTSMNKQ